MLALVPGLTKQRTACSKCRVSHYCRVLKSWSPPRLSPSRLLCKPQLRGSSKQAACSEVSEAQHRDQPSGEGPGSTIKLTTLRECSCSARCSVCKGFDCLRLLYKCVKRGSHHHSASCCGKEPAISGRQEAPRSGELVQRCERAQAKPAFTPASHLFAGCA